MSHLASQGLEIQRESHLTIKMYVSLKHTHQTTCLLRRRTRSCDKKLGLNQKLPKSTSWKMTGGLMFPLPLLFPTLQKQDHKNRCPLSDPLSTTDVISPAQTSACLPARQQSKPDHEEHAKLLEPSMEQSCCSAVQAITPHTQSSSELPHNKAHTTDTCKYTGKTGVSAPGKHTSLVLCTKTQTHPCLWLFQYLTFPLNIIMFDTNTV